MSRFSTHDQWRSFQTFIAAYLVGMLHPLDVFTISRRQQVAPPLVEFRYDSEGVLRFSMWDSAWGDEPDDFVRVPRDGANRVAAQTVEVLRGLDGVDEPSALRLSGSGPASSVAVLARGCFLSGGVPGAVHPARQAAQLARMTADIDVDGDVIEAAAVEVGERAFAGTRSGSIAAIATARKLGRLRTWVDPFSPTPQSGYLVGGRGEGPAPLNNQPPTNLADATPRATPAPSPPPTRDSGR